MGWIESPDAYQLRALFPDVAYALENVAVKANLEGLGVRGKLVSGKKSARIVINLTQGFKMRITPTDRGPGGYSEWFTIVRCECRSQRAQYFCDACQKTGQKETIRAYVEIYSDSSDRATLNCSHTIHEDSIETLVTSAVRGFNRLSGAKIEPEQNKHSRSKKNESRSA